MKSSGRPTGGRAGGWVQGCEYTPYFIMLLLNDGEQEEALEVGEGDIEASCFRGVGGNSVGKTAWRLRAMPVMGAVLPAWAAQARL